MLNNKNIFILLGEWKHLGRNGRLGGRPKKSLAKDTTPTTNATYRKKINKITYSSFS